MAGEDIAAGETGHLHVVGVFEMEKATGDVTMGAALYYSATDKKITTTASGNVPAGYAAAYGQRGRNRTGEAAGLRAGRKRNMKRLTAQRPILYGGRMYQAGDTLPAYDKRISSGVAFR